MNRWTIERIEQMNDCLCRRVIQLKILFQVLCNLDNG